MARPRKRPNVLPNTGSTLRVLSLERPHPITIDRWEAGQSTGQLIELAIDRPEVAVALCNDLMAIHNRIVIHADPYSTIMPNNCNNG